MSIKEPKEQESPIFELETWREIIKDEGWKYFLNLLNEHKENLDSQIHGAIRSKKWEVVSDYQSRIDECNKILQLVEGRLAELRKNKED